MKTPGPATSRRTLSLPLPQKEQRHKRRLLASRESFRLNTWPTRQDTLPTSARQDPLTPSHDDVDKTFDCADSDFWLVPADPQAARVEAAYVDFSRPASEALTD